MREVGTALFAAIFVDRVYGRYTASLQEAARRGEPLRVVLRLRAQELAGLPWETLFDSESGEYLCQREPVVRYVESAQPTTPLTVDPPLRILGLIAAPTGLPRLDVAEEHRRLDEAVKGLSENGQLELVWATAGNWAALQELLQFGPWHALHFVGHGGIDQGHGVLALEDESTGKAAMVSAARFARLLHACRPVPRLIVLNSCQSGEAAADDLLSSTAAALVHSGVSAAVAMQFAVTDPAALAFARGFYRAVAHGKSVDEAVRLGRIAIDGTSEQTLEWVTPVLYLRTNDTHLFTVSRHTTPISVVHPSRERETTLYRLYLRALASARTGRYEESIALLDSLLTLAPNYRDAVQRRNEARNAQWLLGDYKRALAAEKVGDWDHAVEIYDTVLAIDPEYQDAQVRRDTCRRARDIASLQDEMRLHAAVQDWEAVLSVDDQLKALDPGSADPDLLASKARDITNQRIHEDAVETDIAASGTGPRVPAPAVPTHPVVDNDVRFTVYRPQQIWTGKWASLLVYVHKTELVDDPLSPEKLDPIKQVEARANAVFGDKSVHSLSQDARHGLPRGTVLRITPDFPGIQCRPHAVEFEWSAPPHEAAFKIRASPELAGGYVFGTVRIWCGPFLLGEISIRISIADGSGATPVAEPVAEAVRRYRKIFPSYSSRDASIVATFAESARAIGDEFLRNAIELKSKERGHRELLTMIDEADVFQLFWSNNSMRSSRCQSEWEYALGLNRPHFIRPLYWEEPFPVDSVLGQPSDQLRDLTFVKVGSNVTYDGSNQKQPFGRGPTGPRKSDLNQGPASSSDHYNRAPAVANGPSRNACSECGARNEPGAQFCVTCGIFLSWDEANGSGGPAVASPPPALQSDRRSPVTGRQDPGRVASNTAADSVHPKINGDPRMVVEPKTIAIVGGGEETISIEIYNLSPLVDAFVVSAPQAPDWLVVSSAEVTLLPNMSGRTELHIKTKSDKLVPTNYLRLLIRTRSISNPEWVANDYIELSLDEAAGPLLTQAKPVALDTNARSPARSIKAPVSMMLIVTAVIGLIIGVMIGAAAALPVILVGGAASIVVAALLKRTNQR